MVAQDVNKITKKAVAQERRHSATTVAMIAVIFFIFVLLYLIANYSSLELAGFI
jgi:uncharacterized integral membrane protein